MTVAVEDDDPRPTPHAPRCVEGAVIQALPSGLYVVDVGGRHRITAHIGGKIGKNFVRILVGDRVSLELSAQDPTRGRILKRLG